MFGVLLPVDGVVLAPGLLLLADELQPATASASATPPTTMDRIGFTFVLAPPGAAAEHTLPPMTSSDVETVERTIPQPPEAIFAFLADPRRHHEIDGSGAVGHATSSPERVKLGDKFTMQMKLVVPYKMVSTIIEYEDNRRIAWQSRSPGFGGRFAGGRIWRYELEPVSGGTRVRESWDISQEKTIRPLLRVGRVRQHTREAMESTLANIEKLLAP